MALVPALMPALVWSSRVVVAVSAPDIPVAIVSAPSPVSVAVPAAVPPRNATIITIGAARGRLSQCVSGSGEKGTTYSYHQRAFHGGAFPRHWGKRLSLGAAASLARANA